MNDSTTMADHVRRTHWWVRLIGIIVLAPIAIAAAIGVLIIVASAVSMLWT